MLAYIKVGKIKRIHAQDKSQTNKSHQIYGTSKSHFQTILEKKRKKKKKAGKMKKKIGRQGQELGLQFWKRTEIKVPKSLERVAYSVLCTAE